MATIAYNRLTIPRSALLSAILALAMLTSSVVFTEPAPVDVLMAGFIVALCILGCGRVGPATTINMALWLPVIALGFLATTLSPDFSKALIHQIVTLFLLLGAAAIAAFVAADPERRAKLVFNFYVAGVAIACVLAYIGYFKLLPGAHELFTKYERARGTFKDPNVFGAAIAPAMTYLCWQLLRRPSRSALLPALLFMFMAPAMILTFSRGAWVSLFVSLVVLLFIAMTRTRRASDNFRMLVYAVTGFIAMVATMMAILQIPEVSDLLRQRASLTQGYDEGPEGRFGGQTKAIRLILDNPLGIGTFTFRAKHHHEEVHNVFLTQFHNAGWIGGLLFIASISLTFVLGLIGAMRVGALQGSMAVATACMAGLIVEGFVIDSDHWRHFFIILGLMWGLSDAAQKTFVLTRRSTDPESLVIQRG